MKRILILIDTNIGGRGGAEKHLSSVVSRLDPEEFSIDLIQLAQEVPSASGKIGAAAYSHFPIGNPLSIGGIKRIFRLYRLMQRGNYDAVVSYFETSDLIAGLLGPLAKIKIRISSRRDTGFQQSGRMKKLYPILNKRFTHILAASNAIGQSVSKKKSVQDKIRIIYNGVDSSRFTGQSSIALRKELNIPQEELVIGTVANFNPVKNHRMLFACIERLHQSGRRVHLVLAGEGPLQSQLEQLARDLRVENYIHFLGTRNDIENVLDAIDIFALTSRTEGMSNAILEAMAAGNPVVATRVGGNPEVVRHNETGYLVEDDNVEELYGRMKEMIDDELLRKKMGEYAKQLARSEFSIENMIYNYKTLLTTATAEKVGVRDSAESPAER